MEAERFCSQPLQASVRAAAARCEILKIQHTS
jgi:hypothetical protein